MGKFISGSLFILLISFMIPITSVFLESKVKPVLFLLYNSHISNFIVCKRSRFRNPCQREFFVTKNLLTWTILI